MYDPFVHVLSATYLSISLSLLLICKVGELSTAHAVEILTYCNAIEQINSLKNATYELVKVYSITRGCHLIA